MKKYAYSYDQEEYHGEFDTRAEALAECIANDDSDGLHAVWTGEIVEGLDLLRAGSRAYFLAENAIDLADEMLSDDIAADDRIIDVTDAQKEELGRVIVEWLCANAECCRWGVKNVQEHSDEKEEPTCQK
jgi:hypothetical protein